MQKIPLVIKVVVVIVVLGLAFFIATKLSNSTPSSTNNQSNSNISNVALEVEMSSQPVTTYSTKASFTFTTNKEVSIEQKETVTLYKLKKIDQKFLYVIEFKNLPIGTVTKKFKVKDESAQEKEFSLTMTREAYALPLGLKEIEDWEGYGYTADADNLLAQIDKKHKLVADYVPTDLVDLNTDYLLYTNFTNIMLRRPAADALRIMLRDLKTETGEDLVIYSGFRNINDQYKIYASWLRSYSQEESDKFSARPGFSEHHLGTVIDFTNKDVNYELDNNFTSTATGQWLVNNAYKYGFVQSYQGGKETITGYQPEAWHWRFIGVDSAKLVKESGLTLTEWLQKNNSTN